MPQSVQNLVGKLIKVEPPELPAALLSFAFVFLLMAAYYVLRPVRDAMSSDWSDAELSWLWTLNFFISAAIVLVYGSIVSRVNPRQLVPGVYVFFASSFLLVYFAAHWFESTTLIDKTFYVWVSFFALFHVSVFWSFMADIYSRSQSKRLFGFFAAGASIGAVAGPTMPVFLGEMVGVYNLLLIAALILLLVVPIILFLEKSRSDLAGNRAAEVIPIHSIVRDFIGGVIDFFNHRFLLGIGLFILLYTMMSSFVYFELKNQLAGYDRVTRSQYWGAMDLMVNSLSILTALFATSRLATKFGLTVTLAVVPVLLVCGWIGVAVVPALSLLIGLQIIRRAGNYAITRPGREMLFTAVSRETRFKTKPVIDIVVYRGGDVLAGWTYTGLAQLLGLGLSAIATIAALMALVWTAVAIFLGARFEHNSNLPTSADAVIAESSDD